MLPNSSPSIKSPGEDHDSVLYLGEELSTTARLLEKLGFETSISTSETTFKHGIASKSPDVMVIDTTFTEQPSQLVEFLRNFDLTKDVPIVVFSSSGVVDDLSKDFPKVESVFSSNPGVVAGKVATTLRLAMMRGEAARGSSIHEKNLALRTSLREYKKEWEEAKIIQASLLANKKLHLQGIDISVLHQPLHEIGGDWYFIENFSKDSLFVSLCDVTGHGLSAAFLGSMTRLALHAGKEQDLSGRIELANNLLTPELPEGRFITGIAVDIQPSIQELKLVRSGHPPALWFRSNENQIQELKPNGFALGFMEGAEFPSQTIKYDPGDVLLMYSDGITEATNRFKEQYGLPRLKEFLLQVGRLESAEAIKDAIKTSLDDFLDGRKMNDDLTIIVLKLSK